MKADLIFALAVVGVVLNYAIIFYNAWILISIDVGLEEQAFRALMLVAGGIGLSMPQWVLYKLYASRRRRCWRQSLRVSYDVEEYDEDEKGFREVCFPRGGS